MSQSLSTPQQRTRAYLHWWPVRCSNSPPIHAWGCWPQCVVEFGNNHFVIDGDQLYVHDGSTATRVGEDMFDVEFSREL